MTPLHVAVDGSALGREAGGARRYVSELLTALSALHQLKVTVVGVGATMPLPAGIERRGTAGPRNNLVRTVWTVARGARAVHADVLHAPAYTAPFWGAPPVVLTVHDVSYERRPEWYPWRRDPIRRAFYRLSATHATLIVTDSEFSRSEIVAAYGIAGDRIRVIPLGVGPTFTPDPSPRRAAPAYVLHVGELHARRDVTGILEAVVHCRASAPALNDLRLVLVGADRGTLGEIRTHARRLGAEGALDVRGVVDEPALIDLYRRAAVLAHASRYEGFGLPILEAMACGTPVVAVLAASAGEVAGDAALLVRPDDPRELAAGLRAVLTDPARAAALRAAGLARARQFTWQRVAEQTVAVYREAASRG